MPVAQLRHQTLYYEALGAEGGAPILLMHGFMQIGRDLLALANSLTASGYRVYLPDLPGYGRSIPPGRTFPPDFYHRDALCMGELLETLNLTNIHIMGFSDGGEVALLVPIYFPARCRSVVAWGAIGAYSKTPGEYIQADMPPIVITDVLRARHPGQAISVWQGEWIKAALSIIESGGDLSLNRANEIRCPLLLMVGDHDRLNPVEDARRFTEAVTNAPATLRIFANTGHEIHDQHPDLFLETVLGFFKIVP